MTAVRSVEISLQIISWYRTASFIWNTDLRMYSIAPKDVKVILYAWWTRKLVLIKSKWNWKHSTHAVDSILCLKGDKDLKEHGVMLRRDRRILHYLISLVDIAIIMKIQILWISLCHLMVTYQAVWACEAFLLRFLLSISSQCFILYLYLPIGIMITIPKCWACHTQLSLAFLSTWSKSVQSACASLPC